MRVQIWPHLGRNAAGAFFFFFFSFSRFSHGTGGRSSPEICLSLRPPAADLHFTFHSCQAQFNFSQIIAILSVHQTSKMGDMYAWDKLT